MSHCRTMAASSLFTQAMLLTAAHTLYHAHRSGKFVEHSFDASSCAKAIDEAALTVERHVDNAGSSDHPQAAGLNWPNDTQGRDAGAMIMTGALDAYPMTRDGSGTSWQPDQSIHEGTMTVLKGWTTMLHGIVNFVDDRQTGKRGGHDDFVNGMVMAMALHHLGSGTLELRTMLAPDPVMGPRGYALLLQTGETADGRTPLVDRQHPHDLLMEASASVSQPFSKKGSFFVYAGLPGEPALGPPAFMHRESAMDSPEAPISHHWLDSTHVSFGVVTAGIVLDRLKIEFSRFNGREPDQHRWNIETGPLDSTAIRIAWNPNEALALQGSWGHLRDPEQLRPGVDQERITASLLYARQISPDWKLAATLAWGRRIEGGRKSDAFLSEVSLKRRRLAIFARGESVENSELSGLDDGPAYRVGKLSLGAVRDLALAKHVSAGFGGLISLSFVPRALAPAYGTRNPLGRMLFARIKLD